MDPWSPFLTLGFLQNPKEYNTAIDRRREEKRMPYPFIFNMQHPEAFLDPFLALQPSRF
jgi:hypothetical protein